MKRIIALCLLLLITVSPVLAQVEAGDTEVSLLGYFSTFVGDDVDPNGSGSVQLSYGKFVTPFLQLGIAPTMNFRTGEDEMGDPKVETDFSGSVFFNLNFSVASRTIPYITARYYQFTFDIPDEAEFTDYSYMTVGLGVKNFFNEYAAFNTLATYGFALAEESEGGIIVIMTGLSFIF